MIMKYEMKHYWKTWETKLKSMFGGSKEPDEGLTDDGYDWKPGESLKRLNDPKFKENVDKL